METGMRKGFVTLALVLTAGTALAQNKKAEALNDEGKDLYSDGKDYEGAAVKFRQAIAIAPDARYYFNLCSALDKLDLYDQALQACDDVFQHKPRPDLATKTGKKAADIRQRMKAAEAEPPAEPGTSPSPQPPPYALPSGTPDKNDRKDVKADPPPDAKPSDPAMAASRSPGPVMRQQRTLYDRTEASVEREGRYGWALSFQIGPVRNNYGTDLYKRGGLDLKLGVDLMVVQKLRMGFEPYLHFTNFGPNIGTGSNALSIFDIGAAWFWHVRLGSSNFYVTPIAGLSISFLNPQGLDSSYGTVGIRLETTLNWVIGERHVLSLGPALTIYPRPGQVTGTSTDSGVVGLDGTGSTFAFVLGYAYRFDYGWFVGLPLE